MGELTMCGALIRYAAPLYVDIKKTIITRQPDGEEEEIEETYPKTFLGEVGMFPVQSLIIMPLGLSSNLSCHMSILLLACLEELIYHSNLQQ